MSHALIPPELRLVEQDSHKFGNGHGRMRVVELNGNLVREDIPVSVGAQKAPHEIGERAGDQEILLHEAKSRGP